MVIFLFLTNIFGLYIGDILSKGRADIEAFFSFFPYILVLFIPAIAMKIWAEERKTGTIEILLTLPITSFELVIGKFLASWFFSIISIIATISIWITISFLGDPDHSKIIGSYIVSILLSGGLLGICGFLSACTNNQIISFISGVLICFLLLIIGLPVTTENLEPILPNLAIESIGNFSILTQFNQAIKGNFSADILLYFITLTLLGLYLTVKKIEDIRKGV